MPDASASNHPAARLAPQATADIAWNDDGSPHCQLTADSGDDYFSRDGGLNESDYIFLSGNHLPERWRHRPFCIGELGFGTGLNLATVLRQRRGAERDNLPWLSYWTVEHRPLATDDFKRAHQQWPQLCEEWQAIETSYPPAWHGWHTRLLRRYRVQVTYVWDNVDQALADAQINVDAWFLDGFNPKLNTSMWSPEIITELTRCSSAGATLATYTAAGVVRRSLQAVGWHITKRRGYGRKRESIQGTLSQRGGRTRQRRRLPYLPVDTQLVHSSLPVAIVGAGIAGCALAHRLHQFNRSVHLFDLADNPGSAASGNPAGWLHPLLRDPHAVQGAWYDAAWNSAANSHDWPLQRLASGAAWLAPDQVTADKWSQRHVDPAIAQPLPSSDGAPFGGWDMPGAFVISPAHSCFTLAQNSHFHSHTAIIDAEGTAGSIWLTAKNGQKFGPFAAVVWSHAGAALATHPQLITSLRDFPYRYAKGHIIEVSQQPLRQSAGERYILSSAHGAVIGTDYRPRQRDNVVDPSVAQWAEEDYVRDHFQEKPTVRNIRAAVRCTTPDHLPLIGPLINRQTTQLEAWRRGATACGELSLNDGLRGHYVSLAHGSRGLTGACYAAEHLAAVICGIASPLPHQDQQACDANRYWLRKLRQSTK